MSDNPRFRAWQEAQKLAMDAHRFANSIPMGKSADLQNQLRRAANSLPDHLSEGRPVSEEEAPGKFISDSIGSLEELETLFYLSGRMGYGKPDRIQPAIAKLRKVKSSVFALRKSLLE